MIRISLVFFTLSEFRDAVEGRESPLCPTIRDTCDVGSSQPLRVHLEKGHYKTGEKILKIIGLSPRSKGNQGR